jgi:hypothetical protein
VALSAGDRVVDPRSRAQRSARRETSSMRRAGVRRSSAIGGLAPPGRHVTPHVADPLSEILVAEPCDGPGILQQSFEALVPDELDAASTVLSDRRRQERERFRVAERTAKRSSRVLASLKTRRRSMSDGPPVRRSVPATEPKIAAASTAGFFSTRPEAGLSRRAS